MSVDIVLPIALVMMLLGVWLLLTSRRQRATLHLPEGNFIYNDSPELPGETLISRSLKLAGKPDILIRNGDMVVPVEIKTGRVPDIPFLGHIMQLAAYCHLVEQHYHTRPTHGILRYGTKEFKIPYTTDLEQQLELVLLEMHAKRDSINISRSHNSRPKCAACSYRSDCSERLDTEVQPHLL
ncbi:MAG: Dna2/Cas4 domain-containing protein [Anaerolineae bacterium]